MEYKRQSVLKVTTSDWSRSYAIQGWYDGNKPGETKLVEIALTQVKPASFELFRVSASGNDDTGLERDFSSFKEAYDCFMRILAMDIVNDNDLIDQFGFYGA